MAIFVFVLGLLLIALGLSGMLTSLDLLPTELGMLYAACGTVAASAGVIVVAIGALIRKIDAVSRVSRAPIEAAPPVEPFLDVAPPVEPFLDAAPPVEPAAPPDTGEAAAEEDPVNENRTGRLPTLSEVEHAITEPEPPPTLVGRYKSGGAHYMIFSDGTIEAETEQGAFRFASMGDFKAYIAGRKS